MYVEMGGSKDGIFRRHIITDKRNIRGVVHDFNETDVYATIYEYDTTNQDTAGIVAPFYIDMDIDDIANNFKDLLIDLRLVVMKLKNMFNLKDEDIKIYFSGSKGFHILIDYRIFGFNYSKNINEQYKMLALKLKTYTITKCIDTKIYDRKRLFRIPNTINSKTGLYKVPISFKKVITMSYDDMVKYASNKHFEKISFARLNEYAALKFEAEIEEIKQSEKKMINTKVMKDFIKNRRILPCVEYLLQNGATQGNRNNLTIALASSLLQSGKDGEEVLDIVISWNALKNEPKLPDNEIRTTVMSAIKNFEFNRNYGCGSFKNLDMCLKKCPIHK